MRRVFALIALFALSLPCFSFPCERGSSFRVLGDVELYETPSAHGRIGTHLNTEGGLSVTALSVGEEEGGGRWVFVLLNAGTWVRGGKWIPAYSKLWIFLSDGAIVYDYENP